MQNDKRMLEFIIAQKVRPLKLQDALDDFERLKKIYNEKKMSPLARSGLKFINFFTFQNRLAVRGKMGLNFYDFLSKWEEFQNKKYIKTIHDEVVKRELYKYENNDPENIKIKYHIYNITINCIHVFRPAVALDIYHTYCPTSILDVCCGWGGRATAAAVYGCSYLGIDINKELSIAYERMSSFLGDKINMIIFDSLQFDYSNLKYDMVFTSPPYYNLEIYEHNAAHKTKDAWDELFYKPLFTKVWKHLQPGGKMILNINDILYSRVFSILFGAAQDRIELSKRQRSNGKNDNKYIESMYVWNKEPNILLL